MASSTGTFVCHPWMSVSQKKHYKDNDLTKVECVALPSSLVYLFLLSADVSTKELDVQIPPHLIIWSEAFRACEHLTTVDMGLSRITHISGNAFTACVNLETVVLPHGLETINKFAFFGCMKLRAIPLPPTLSHIGEMAFGMCTSLVSIDIPARIQAIEECAFYKCTALSSVSLPEGLENILFFAFYGCTSLTEIRLPSTMKNVELGHIFTDTITLTVHMSVNTVTYGVIPKAFTLITYS